MSASAWSLLSMATDGHNIYTGTALFSMFHTSGGGNILLSTDDGWNWSILNYNDRNASIEALACSGTNVFAGTYGEGIFRSTNSGATWSRSQNGISETSIFSLAIDGSNVYAGTYTGIFKSLNDGVSWSRLSNFTYEVRSIALSGSKIYAASGGINYSTNSGGNWTNIGPSGSFVYSIFLKDNIIYAGAANSTNNRGGIYRSSNNGANWTYLTYNVNTGVVYSVIAQDTNIFIGGERGVFVSTNNGINWIQKNQSSNNLFPQVFTLLILNDHIFAGTWRRQLAEILDSTKKVTEFPPPVPPVYSYYLSQNYPNPFNPNTVIRYSLIENRYTTLKVFDALGKEVATLVNENQSPGTHQVELDGSGFPSGVYFLQTHGGNFSEKMRMMLVK
ncbi:MAG: T9SS type A sorting domain-containing protein [Ignavibacteria bacterium]|nr:T9SS type A sorting domain-containing protein [Ignavibacteria bacterium]